MNSPSPSGDERGGGGRRRRSGKLYQTLWKIVAKWLNLEMYVVVVVVVPIWNSTFKTLSFLNE